MDLQVYYEKKYQNEYLDIVMDWVHEVFENIVGWDTEYGCLRMYWGESVYDPDRVLVIGPGQWFSAEISVDNLKEERNTRQ